MRTVLTAAQMKAADAMAIRAGVPSLVLMERAALSVVQELMSRKEYDLKRVCIFCGSGNNAGDGVAIGRILKDFGYDATLILTGPVAKYSEDMAQQVAAARNRGIHMVMEADRSMLAHATLIIDALFGVGLTRDVTGEYAAAIRCMNEAKAPVVAVDIPSGIHSDTGEVMGCAPRCAMTVTFARAKRGLLFHPGAACAGEVVVKEIGIPVEESLLDGDFLYQCEEEDLALLPARNEAGNKGTFKKILVIAGSKTMFGAAALCAEAAMRTGAGMVKVYTEESNRIPLFCRLPEALLTTYKEEEWMPLTDGMQLLEDLSWADAVVIGPGFSKSSTALSILMYFMDWNSRHGKKPTVFDADALNLLAEQPSLMKQINYPAVFTPHLGEMSRLGIWPLTDLKENPVYPAEFYARQNQVTLVMKDARTVIASPDGRLWVNTRGNSALATAGSGDVLAGITAALLAQMPQVPETAALAVLIHALAGERAAEKKGSKGGVIAGDLLQEIPGILPD
ncbi:MAG: NAD(P)H-hydrate dehydratase [Lachnospiraceae bacterium]|nr:NAD(P)H-hydrate dehydratase [Lachnospiraceae bacterium]